MKCKICGEKLEVYRACRKIRMKCTACSKEYQIHEVADQLDRQTEEILSKYTSIVYD